MSNIVFPRPLGTAWEFKWGSGFETLIQKGANPGYETRISLGPDPIRTAELSYAILKDGSLGSTLDQLRDFYDLRKGEYDSFLVDVGNLTGNSAKSSATGQVVTVSAGVAALQITRAVGSETYGENIYEVAGVNGNPGSAPVIKSDGTPLASGTDYTWHGPGYAVAGVTYPGLALVFTYSIGGHVITADFTYYYRMRFAIPQIEFNRFFALAYKAQQIQLVTTRTQ